MLVFPETLLTLLLVNSMKCNYVINCNIRGHANDNDRHFVTSLTDTERQTKKERKRSLRCAESKAMEKLLFGGRQKDMTGAQNFPLGHSLLCLPIAISVLLQLLENLTKDKKAEFGSGVGILHLVFEETLTPFYSTVCRFFCIQFQTIIILSYFA